MTRSHAIGCWIAAATFCGAAQAPAQAEPTGNVAAVTATAACEPLLTALRRARAEPVVAQYLVDAGALPVSRFPLAFRVGDLVHETEFGQWVAQQLAPGQDSLVLMLEAELAQGRAWCESNGSTTYHGVAVDRIRFRHPQLAALYQPATVLVEAASGLPLWHGYAGMDGGYAWVYGPGPLVLPPPSTLKAQP